jgi:hypothetical protein
MLAPEPPRELGHRLARDRLDRHAVAAERSQDHLFARSTRRAQSSGNLRPLFAVSETTACEASSVAAGEQRPQMNSAHDPFVASFRLRGRLPLDGEREADRSEELDKVARRGKSLPVAH